MIREAADKYTPLPFMEIIMNELSITTFLLVCPLVFLAGLLDSIAGGGGLISLPAYLMAGLPGHTAVATNKLSSTLGTAVSTARYLKKGCVKPGLIFPTVAAALAGSLLGARLLLLTDERSVRFLLLAVLPAAAFIVLRPSGPLSEKTAGTREEPPLRGMLLPAVLCSFVIGAYDGFYGPGTGTFLMLALTGIVHMDVRSASGNSKCINLASNAAALITFLINGRILIPLGLAAAACSVLGNYIGSGLVVKNGAKIVRPVVIIALILVTVRLLADL